MIPNGGQESSGGVRVASEVDEGGGIIGECGGIGLDNEDIRGGSWGESRGKSIKTDGATCEELEEAEKNGRRSKI
ncbi:hypothetical protein NL676_036528 [Syzygium grande]|nr:hypothetical protein NL676_036528 [Syzygium grande]